MTEDKKYSYLTTIIKGIKTGVVFGLPLILAFLAQWDPAITSITLGTILVMVQNWAKHA